MTLLDESVTLTLVKAEVRKHAGLRLDVLPSPRGLELLCEQIVQLLTHADDTVGHGGNVPVPFSTQFGLCQDLGDNARTKGGHRTVLAPGNYVELALYGLSLLG